MRLAGAIVAVALAAGCGKEDGGGKAWNRAPDEGPPEPQELVAREVGGVDAVSDAFFTPNGRYLLGATRVVTVWELDASKRSLREVGWFGFAEDRDEPPPGTTSDLRRLEEWLETHEGIDELVLTPDGKHVIAGGKKRLAIWRLQPRSKPIAKKLGEFRDPDDDLDLYGLALSPDGKKLLVLRRPGEDHAGLARARGLDPDEVQGMIQLFEVDPGADEPLRARGVVFTEDRPGAAAFTADGRFAVAVGSSQLVMILAMKGRGGIELVREEKADDTIEEIVALPDDRFATGGFDQVVRLWRLERDPEPRLVAETRLRHVHQGKLHALAAARDGSWLVASSTDHSISLWPLAAVKPGVNVAPITFQPPDEYVYGLAIHPHGPFLATAGDGVRVWRVNRERLRRGGGTTPSAVARAHAVETDAPIGAADWLDEATLVTASSDGSVRRWTVDAGGVTAERVVRATSSPPVPGGDGWYATDVAGAVALLGAPNGDLVVVDAAAGAEATLASGQPKRQAVSLGGRCAASAGAGGAAVTWRRDGTALAPAGQLDTGLTWVSTLQLSGDGALLVVAGSGADHAGVLAIHGLDPETCAPTAATRVAIPSTPSGTVGSHATYPGGGGAAPGTAAFSRDRSWLLTGEGDGGGAILWRVVPGPGLEKVDFLLGHTSGVDAAAFAPDGAWAITGGDGGETYLWRLTARGDRLAAERIDELQPLTLRSYFHQDIVFSPGGRRAAAVGGWSRFGRIWVYELAR